MGNWEAELLCTLCTAATRFCCCSQTTLPRWFGVRCPENAIACRVRPFTLLAAKLSEAGKQALIEGAEKSIGPQK